MYATIVDVYDMIKTEKGKFAKVKKSKNNHALAFPHIYE